MVLFFLFYGTNVCFCHSYCSSFYGVFLMWRSFFVINKWAGAILIPYFVWIMFACFLNINIANMN
ncbi:MAG: tryptophan-rich sensory protein [Alphaproteobacteria bacterium]|nr:tryptophan-rich sensory protein [Alphaproteobacteria bacterium]